MFDSLSLFEMKYPGACYPVLTEPADFMSDADFSFISINAFGGTQRHVNSFALRRTFFFSMKFSIRSALYSIVIATKQPFPRIYLDFLEDAYESISHSITSLTPISIFGLIKSLLGSWVMKSARHILAFFVSGPKQYKLNWRYQTFSHFDPLSYFENSVDFVGIWKSILTGKTVTITAKDAEDLSFAAYSLCSLATPFPFRDPILVTLNPNDPRIAEGSFSIIAAPMLREAQLKVCKNGQRKSESVRKVISQRADLLYGMLEQIFGRNLINDPYYDLLGGPLITDDLKGVLSECVAKKALNFEELKEFEATETLKQWKHSMRFGKCFRDAFLSTSPEAAIELQTKCKLMKASYALEEIKKEFQNDEHMIMVFKRHRKIISKLISMKRYDESSDSIEISSE